MKIFIAALAYIYSFSILNAQVILEKTLQPYPPKSKKLMNYGLGINSALSGTGHGTPTTLLSDVASIPGDGFLIRYDYTFFRYNDNMELLWQKEFEPTFRFGSTPYSIMLGDSAGNSYFVEFETQKPNGIAVTRFDKSGNKITQKYTSKTKAENLHNWGAYINKNGLNIIRCEIDFLTVKQYTLLTFSGNNLNPNENPLNLKIIPGEERNNWRTTLILSDKVIVSKVYNNPKKGSEEYWYFETAEIDNNGVVGNYRKISMPKSSELWSPTIEISSDGKDLFLHGHVTRKNSTIRDAFYISKYDYGSFKEVFTNIYDYAAIGYPVPDRKAEYYQSYPSISLEFGAHEYRNNNDVLSITLRLSQPSSFKPTLCSVNLDADGEIISVVENKFVVSPMLYKRPLDIKFVTQFFQVPSSSKVIQKTSQTTALTPLDYLNSKADPEYRDDYIYTIVPANKYNLLIYFSDKTKEIKAIKLKK